MLHKFNLYYYQEMLMHFQCSVTTAELYCIIFNIQIYISQKMMIIIDVNINHQ